MSEWMNAETGFFTPVLLQPTSLRGPQESKSLFSVGGGLFDNLIQDLYRSRQFLSFHYQTEKKGFYSVHFLAPKNTGVFQTRAGPPLFEYVHCLQNILHAEHQATAGIGSVGRLVHYHQLRGCLFSCQRAELFC